MSYFRDADPYYDTESQEIDYPSDEEDGYLSDDVFCAQDNDFSEMCREVFYDFDRRDDAAYKIQAFWKKRSEKKKSPNVNYAKLEELFGTEFVKNLTQ